MADELSWDLTSPVTYAAGEALECTLAFTAPSDGKYYLMGMLYTAELVYIEGTLFGVLLPEGGAYAINDAGYLSLWEMEADDEKELPCKFTLDRSDVILSIFLMKLEDEDPDLAVDEEIGSVSVSLSSGAAPAPGIDIGSIMGMLVLVMVMGVMIKVATKE